VSALGLQSVSVLELKLASAWVSLSALGLELRSASGLGSLLALGLELRSASELGSLLALGLELRSASGLELARGAATRRWKLPLSNRSPRQPYCKP
jgi:hypothetical protein